MADIESQESFNQDSMLSEPIIPSLDGYPDVKEFDELMRRYSLFHLALLMLTRIQRYVTDLSPKKQDKALIHARRAANIRTVLMDKKTTSVESAQFR
jgi:hypothetical protein